MISAIMYLIAGIVIGIFSYECYLTGYGKGAKNPFANYFFWAALFFAISYIQSVVIIMVSTLHSSSDLLFWADFIARAFFYIGAVFSVRVPLYKLFPKSKKTVIFSYIYALIGVVLMVYQIIYRNIPVMNNSGIINWNAGIVLVVGIAILLIVPWAAISYIFLREFIKSKFSLLKPFLLGSGFFLICIGGSFQDLSSTVIQYIFFGILLAVGFLSALAGMFYEE
jgi:hypothetical protein